MSAALSPAEIEGWLAGSPFIAFLGIALVEADAAVPSLTLRMPLRPELVRSAATPERWHGGAVSAFIDTAGTMALVMLHGAAPATVNLRVDYLRPIAGAFVTATATVRKTGRSIGFVDVDVHAADGTLVAIGRANFATTGLPQPGSKDAA